MEPLEYERMARVEEAHWWYRGMADLVAGLLARYTATNGTLRLLDAGCGTGGALAFDLKSLGLAFGCDVSPLALAHCRRRQLDRTARASVAGLPYPDDTFDIVTSLDVIYERAVIDDRMAIREMTRVLRPRGLLLVRAPAHDWLRGQHDAATHTARRYTLASLGRRLTEAGLELAHGTYANASLFPVVAAKRLLERLVPPAATTSDLDWEAGPLNRPLHLLLRAESRIAVRLGLPLGLSVICVARKADSA
ncbi:MAG: class I SAM-dependent methyltransferase [Anaerolineales bacterium]|nr:class I SAM-dependent methyltransferase [Anaerolineales bacterium]